MTTTITSQRKKRTLNVRADAPDLRDRYYEPPLIQLAAALDNANPALVRDQGTEGACTGFGLAAVIDGLLGADSPVVSTRMLYTMAQFHDEWPGEDYAGSSCRGAIKGWKNMGVCSEVLWPYAANDPGALTLDKAKDARKTILGAYYRLRPNLNDYHAALNSSGAIFVSATLHTGWNNPRTRINKDDRYVTIVQSSEITGGHAFAIVGYNSDGFIIQNSWGGNWGSDGFAIWRYEDWYENVTDAWAFQLAVPTPRVFELTNASTGNSLAESLRKSPDRAEIAGHFAHFDDGTLVDKGKYWSTHQDLTETMNLVRERAQDGSIEQFVVFVHGGLVTPKSSAIRIRAMKDGFKRNGIYPFHIMYDTGFAEELGDVLARAFRRSEGLLDKWKNRIQDASDKIVEGIVHKPGTALWEEIKRGAYKPFEEKTSDGNRVIRGFIDALDGTGVPVHIIGHSTGGILLGHLLHGIDLASPCDVRSCSLLAPACSIDFYKDHYLPRLSGNSDISQLGSISLYNLTDELEQDDTVTFAYRKSLLYLVSRAFERTGARPLLGMEKYSKKLKAGKLKQHYSSGRSSIARSKTHGGFDNDHYTMNSVLKTILGGKKPAKPFTEAELAY